MWFRYKSHSTVYRIYRVEKSEYFSPHIIPYYFDSRISL